MDIEEELQDEANNNINYLQVAREWFKNMDFNAMVSAENLTANAPFILFLFFLVLVYIGNTHQMETTARDIDRTKDQLKQVRWRYMSAKSELMYNCKQTEVASAVHPLGLRELKSPPNKIVIGNDEY